MERCMPIGEVGCAALASEVGATVEGSVSNQAFTQATERYEDFGDRVIIELQLRGLQDNKVPWRVDASGTYYNGQKLVGVRATTKYDTGEVNLLLWPDQVLYDK
jgi:hypothetical protein